MGYENLLDFHQHFLQQFNLLFSLELELPNSRIEIVIESFVFLNRGWVTSWPRIIMDRKISPI